MTRHKFPFADHKSNKRIFLPALNLILNKSFRLSIRSAFSDTTRDHSARFDFFFAAFSSCLFYRLRRRLRRALVEVQLAPLVNPLWPPPVIELNYSDRRIRSAPEGNRMLFALINQ